MRMMEQFFSIDYAGRRIDIDSSIIWYKDGNIIRMKINFK